MKEQPEAFCISWLKPRSHSTEVVMRAGMGMSGEVGALQQCTRHSVTQLLAGVMLCMTSLGRTERQGCMRAKRSVSQQIVWLNERQHVLGLVWSSAHAAWLSRMWALTVHLGGHLESQHSDGETEFASRKEAALIKSSFSLPKHLLLQNP